GDGGGGGTGGGGWGGGGGGGGGEGAGDSPARPEGPGGRGVESPARRERPDTGDPREARRAGSRRLGAALRPRATPRPARRAMSPRRLDPRLGLDSPRPHDGGDRGRRPRGRVCGGSHPRTLALALAEGV